jgi:hypothetical protein
MTKKHAPQYFICNLNFKSHNFKTESPFKRVASTYRGSTTLSFFWSLLCSSLRTVGGNKRKIRVIKERARGTFSTLPYEMLPKLIIIELMHFCAMWMNSFPVKVGVSEKYSPRELVSRLKLDAKLHCKTPFGAYCEVHTDPDITNTIEPRTRWGICC